MAERARLTERADVALVRRGLSPSRARAAEQIAAGNAYDGERRIERAAERIAPDAALTLKDRFHDDVSRAGRKLSHALEVFPVTLEGAVVLDLGASTGGFTQVCLRRGARRVYAVDVGHGQLHETLRGDPRAVALEGTDARSLDGTLIPEAPDLIVCDLSFIGLSKALGPALALARAGAALIALVKPQFEVGPARVGKGGIVRDAAAREDAIAGVRSFLEGEGWRVQGVTQSPITGKDGNVEFLVHAKRE